MKLFTYGLSAALVQQFGIASWNIVETHHYLLILFGDILSRSCLLIINSCDAVAR